MQAATVAGPKRIALLDLPVPAVTPGHCLVRIAACGICGADRGHWERGEHGTGPDPDPYFGHEAVGTVEQVGAEVERWRVGDRVALYNVIGCGRCRHCLRGEEKYCLTQAVVGQGFREVALVPQANLLPLPDWLGFVPGTLATDVVGTALRAVRQSGLQPGAVAAVWGLGPIGLIVALGAKLWGARHVFGFDLCENHRQIAGRYGVDVALDPATDDVAAAVRDFSADGLDVAFNTVWNNAVAQQAYDLTAFGGTCAMIVAGPEKLDWWHERRVTGAGYFTKPEYEENLRLIESGRIPLQPLISHVLPLAEIDAAFRLRFDTPEQSLKVVVTME
ncbi:MAG: alcohol dehydrogenase catalytic domain-containing protein [Armatimonadetes bacterium]|nr:alcohol dehydrogenase catalytic domain-containing protein [Armatimonadota bacterium]